MKIGIIGLGYIAEGSERETDKERANFLNYAKGSAGELRTQIYPVE